MSTQTISATTSCQVAIRPLPAAAGAVVECKDLAALGDADSKLIRQAWLNHLFLIFHGQELSDPELTEVSRIFGEPEAAAVAPKDGIFHSGLL